MWSNLSGNTAIVGATFRSTFSDVYAARQTLLNRIAAVAKARGDQGVTDAATAQAAANAAQTTANTAATNASAALGEIGTIVADNVLDRSEKPAVTADWDVLYAEQSGIDAQATAYGITTEKAAYDTAISDLASYLLSLSPTWNDFTVDTPITRATFMAKFQDAYTARTNVLNRIAAVAGTLANWSGVSGAGRPADNATVGADWAANLSSRPAELTDGRITAGLDGSGSVNNGKVGTPAIVNNAVTVPLIMSSGTTTYGDGYSYQVLVSGSISLSSAGVIYVNFRGGQGYASGVRNWNLRISVDGTVLSTRGGGAGFTDAVSCSASAFVSSGSHAIVVDWYGQDASLNISNDITYVQGVMK
jgi:hypothetical protein